MKNSIVFSGELRFLNLADLIQLLGTNDSNGILRITSQYAKKPGFIYFKNGNLVDASNGSLNGVDAVYSLFGWSEGIFEFTLIDIEVNKKINQNRMEIILEGLRMLDDGKIIMLGPVSDEQDSAAGIQLTKPLVKGPLIDYMYVLDEEEFLDGAKIVEENKFGNWMWVILNGIVEIVKETPKGPEAVLKIGKGAFIGRLTSFFVRGDTRHATAVAEGNVQLGVLDSQRLSSEYVCMSSELRNIVMSLESRLDQVTDLSIGIGKSDNDLYDFIKGKNPFFVQGEKDTRLFTITYGKAFVIRKTLKGYIKLAILSEGDFVGNIPFHSIGHEPGAASVFGSKDIEVMPID
ncbi:MAG: DUF4388 domain-containing protein, partial [Deltaproteobacteria bacterium]|nr:DUF4388 domain-containing protein [Deltaproteobacteria bacterium]